MKINNIGRMSVNPYKKQAEKVDKLEIQLKKDQIQISDEALQLQKIGNVDKARQQKVEELQDKVSSGQYEVDSKKVAQKLYDFWNN
ncbi:flagellar biosynthesis anti-sigma factor FlgM [Cytobacillus sp. FJAT-54145]|uniref:Negative regulator of flagellin synthesis n=1 Tax=Cytobacillus spartinae TaxID=3299023 RepID=A0ABW6KBW3_9BACI